MKKGSPKTAALLYFLSAACMMILGVVGIRCGWTMPYLFIGFGCAFLCFGFVCLSKAKRDVPRGSVFYFTLSRIRLRRRIRKKT